MQKLEGVVIHIPNNIRTKISFLVGSPDQVADAPVVVFDRSRIDFLADLSNALLEKSSIRSLPDVVAFAFWCRRANLAKIVAKLNTDYLRVGLGLVFHISPSNIPVKFAFSLVFGLLSGNSCVVRLPSKMAVSTLFIVEEISQLLRNSQYASLIPFIHLVKFERKSCEAFLRELDVVFTPIRLPAERKFFAFKEPGPIGFCCA
jgi:hypothetical protein